MASTFALPAVGDTMVEAVVEEWFVAVGDHVALDQVICAIETDKSVVEMTTPFAGTVLQLGGEAGATIAVGEPLIIVGENGEVPQSPAVGNAPESSSAELSVNPVSHSAQPPQNGQAGDVRSPVLRRLAEALDVRVDDLVGSGHAGQITRADIEAAAAAPVPQRAAATPAGVLAPSRVVRAMPKVRRAAREQGIDLQTMIGSGPAGAVLLDDLSGGTVALPLEHRERLSPLRRAIGQHLTESVTTIPQFTSMVDVDVTALLETRKALQAREGVPIPLDALIMGLLVPVLRDHPRMNSSLDEGAGEIVLHERFDIGVAVDTPDGLIVPVVRAAHQCSTTALAAEILRLAAAARDRSIPPTALTGATCTLNNVGAVGLEQGTPILPVGTTAIIAPGRARPVVSLQNGVPVERSVMTMSATFDHRVVDGGDAGRFLTQLRDHLQVPAIGFL